MITGHFNSLFICRFMPDILLFCWDHQHYKNLQETHWSSCCFKGEESFLNFHHLSQHSFLGMLGWGLVFDLVHITAYIYINIYIYIVFYLLPYLFFSRNLSEKGWLEEEMSVFVEGIQEGKWSGCICDCVFLSFYSLCGDGGLTPQHFNSTE